MRCVYFLLKFFFFWLPPSPNYSVYDKYFTMNEHGFPLWKALVAVFLVVWGILSQIGPGRISVLAVCYNLAKLGAISPPIFQVIELWRPPVTINILISACIGALVILMVSRHYSGQEWTNFP